MNQECLENLIDHVKNLENIILNIENLLSKQKIAIFDSNFQEFKKDILNRSYVIDQEYLSLKYRVDNIEKNLNFIRKMVINFKELKFEK